MLIVVEDRVRVLDRRPRVVVDRGDRLADRGILAVLSAGVAAVATVLVPLTAAADAHERIVSVKALLAELDECSEMMAERMDAARGADGMFAVTGDSPEEFLDRATLLAVQWAHNELGSTSVRLPRRGDARLRLLLHQRGRQWPALVCRCLERRADPTVIHGDRRRPPRVVGCA